MSNQEKSKTQALNRRLTKDSDIKEVFDHLGLSNYEQRAKYLSLDKSEDGRSTILYTTRLSNNSGTNNSESLR